MSSQGIAGDERPLAAVVGAGAMGAVFAAALDQAGLEVCLVDADDALVEVINGRGLRLTGPEGERRLRVTALASPAQLPRCPDLVLFAVKCYATKAAAEAVADQLGERTMVVSLQNGWGNGEVLAEALGPQRLVIGVTYVSATVRAPGVVTYSGAGDTHVGPFIGEAEELAYRFAAWLRAGGLPVYEHRDVRTEIWRKLVLNAATLPTAALTGLSAGALGRHPEMAWLVAKACEEAVAVACSEGHQLEVSERQEAIAAVLARAGDGKGSMLQDVEAGRRTEIEVISGAVARIAERNGLMVPVTRCLYSLICGYEAAHGLR